MVYLYALIRARVISFTDSLRSKNCLPPLDMIRRREVNERTNERTRALCLSLSLSPSAIVATYRIDEAIIRDTFILFRNRKRIELFTTRTMEKIFSYDSFFDVDRSRCEINFRFGIISWHIIEIRKDIKNYFSKIFDNTLPVFTGSERQIQRRGGYEEQSVPK